MPLPAAVLLAAAELVPSVMRLFKADKQATVAEQVVDAAKRLTGQDDVAKAIELVKADPALLVQLQAQAKDIAIAELQAETAQHQQTNETIRAELVSSSLFKSGWRPFFGWMITPLFSLWILTIIVVPIYMVLKYPSAAGEVLRLLVDYINALMLIWGAAFAVLGVNIHQRSRDKQVAAGVASGAGLLSLLRRQG